MADDVKIIRIQIDASRAVDGGRAAQRALEDIEKSTGSLSRGMTQLESTMRSLFVGYLGLQGLRAIVQAADGFTQLTNSLKVAGVAGNEMVSVQDRLFAAANKNGAEIGAVGQLYSRLAQSSRELGATQDQLLKFVDGTTAALRIQGGSTQAASGALMQLSQAFAGGIVRAEEFNSILEGATPIAQAAARGIAGMDGSLGKLRIAVTEGKITSQAFFEGLLKGFDETERMAESADKTIGGALTSIENSWVRLVGTLGSTGVFGFVSTVLEGFRLGIESTRREIEMLKRAWDWLTNNRPLQSQIDSVNKDILAFQERGHGLESAALQDLIKRRDALQGQLAQLPTVTVTATRPPPTPDPKKDTGKVKADVDEVAKLIEKIERDAEKMRESFLEGTDALVEQNDLLAVELRLIGETPAVRARELAIIQATNEAKKAGYGTESEAYKARVAALEQGNQLRFQQEEIAKAQELWTEPLKQALRDIQSIGADAFDKLLENGKFSFEELGQTSMRIVRRVAAEFLALATIRPVMSVLVNAVSPSMAQSMGLGSAFPGMGGGGSAGGLSLGGGGLSGGGLLGSMGGWLNSPISFGGALNTSAMSPASMMAPTGASGAMLGGLTWGQGLAGVAGIGAGIYGLATSKTPSGMVGSGLGIIGSGVGLASAMGLIGAAGGPIGMGIGLLGGLLASTGMLDGLLGGAPPTINNQTYGQLTYGSGGWYTTGGAWGPSANASGTQAGLQSLGGGISSVFDMLGGVRDPSKVWGLSAMNHTVSGQGWSSSSDSTYLVDPNGNQQLWRMNEGNMMDTGSAQVAYRSILEGAVGDISELMRQRVLQTGQTMGGTSLQAIAEVINEVQSFEKAMASLGKTSTGAEQALQAINDNLGQIWGYAKEHGLDADVAKIEAHKNTLLGDNAKSFMAQFANDNDPLGTALQGIADAHEAAMKEAAAWDKIMLDNAVGYRIEMSKIDEHFLKLEADTKKSYYEQMFSGVDSLVKSLTYGDLGNASPTTQFQGLKNEWNSTVAKALGGDAAAIAGLAGLGSQFAQAGKQYYGSSTSYFNEVQGQILGDISAVKAANGAADGGMATVSTGLGTVSTQLGELIFTLQGSDKSDEEVKTLLVEAITLMQRLVVKIAA